MKVNILLAATDLASGLGKVGSVISAIAMIWFFGSLIYAAVSFSIGRSEGLAPALLGAGVGGLAWLIVKFLFAGVSNADPGIDLQGF